MAHFAATPLAVLALEKHVVSVTRRSLGQANASEKMPFDEAKAALLEDGTHGQRERREDLLADGLLLGGERLAQLDLGHAEQQILRRLLRPLLPRRAPAPPPVGAGATEPKHAHQRREQPRLLALALAREHPHINRSEKGTPFAAALPATVRRRTA